MTVTTVLSRSLVAAIAVLNVSVTTPAVASPQLVNRGPNGASFITTKKAPNSGTHVKQSKSVKTNQRLVTRGPNGAGFFTTEPEAVGGGQLSNQSARPNYRVIRRGPRGAGFLIND